MKTARSGILLLVTFMSIVWHADAQDAKAAETFVTHLYQRYHTQKDFSPFANPSTVNAIATPSLAALVKRDQKTSAAANEESELDSDPVSGSQDSEGLELASVKIQPTGPGQAKATVTLRIQKERVTRRLFLASVDGGWKIDNITDDQGHDDLRATLTRSIAAHTAGHKH